MRLLMRNCANKRKKYNRLTKQAVFMIKKTTIILLLAQIKIFFFIKIVCERIETYYCQILMCYLCIATKKKGHNDKAVSLTFL